MPTHVETIMGNWDAGSNNPFVDFSLPISNGDLLVVFGAHRSGDSAAGISVSQPSGVTQDFFRDANLGNSSHRQGGAIFSKKCNGTEGTRVQISFSQNCYVAATLWSPDGGEDIFDLIGSTGDDNGATTGGRVVNTGNTTIPANTSHLQIGFSHFRNSSTVSGNVIGNWDNGLAERLMTKGGSNRMSGSIADYTDSTSGLKTSTCTYTSQPITDNNTGLAALLVVYDLISSVPSGTNRTLLQNTNLLKPGIIHPND